MSILPHKLSAIAINKLYLFIGWLDPAYLPIIDSLICFLTMFAKLPNYALYSDHRLNDQTVGLDNATFLLLVIIFSCFCFFMVVWGWGLDWFFLVWGFQLMGFGACGVGILGFIGWGSLYIHNGIWCWWHSWPVKLMKVWGPLTNIYIKVAFNALNLVTISFKVSS